LLNFLHAAGDVADGAHGALRRGLHRRDLAADIVGRLCRLHRKRLHLGGDHGKTLAGRAGARRLDRGARGSTPRLAYLRAAGGGGACLSRRR